LQILLPHRPLLLPLYWQCTRQPLPMLERLTQAVLAAARQGLEGANG
jgi:LysR family transcriptional regulator (chromosome initiation inhibitor)